MTALERCRSTAILLTWLLAGICGILPSFVVTVLGDTHYVFPQSSTPTPPFTNWSTAAHDIQSAIGAAVIGDVVLVTNGLYETGGVAVYGTMTNRVALTNGTTVRSVNGPEWTTIKGKSPIGSGAMRCAYVAAGCMLAGFTLTNGATLATGDYDKEQGGGGVWCETGGVVSNCLVTDCTANGDGGATYAGTLYRCTISSNSAPSGGYGGGAHIGTLYNCTLSGNSAWGGGGAYECSLFKCTIVGNRAAWLGGGASYGTLDNCTIVSNTAPGDGGGTYAAVQNNCLLSENSATGSGGGVAYGVLNSCTLTGNSTKGNGGGAIYATLNNCTLAGNSAGSLGGGTYRSALTNCIAYYNSATSDTNYSGGSLVHCCTTPLAPGSGNISEEPQFMDTNQWRNLRLVSGSPCINAGTNMEWMAQSTDLDGKGRIIRKRVDMGSYEYSDWGGILIIR